ncbi:hypothetical protein D3C81_1364870 [compost metagenome]
MNSQQLRSALQQAAKEHRHHPVVDLLVQHLQEQRSSLFAKLAKADSQMEVYRLQGNLQEVEKTLGLLDAQR